MELVGTALSGIASLGWLICFILILVKMFQNGQAILAIVCLVCCGFGGLIAFIFGWVKSGEWGTKNIMLVWTVCWILLIIGGAINPATFSGLTSQIPGR